MAYVYAHYIENQLKPFYIGCSSQTRKTRAYDFIDRTQSWKNHVKDSRVIVEIIKENLTWEKAIKLEEEMISLYKRVCEGGILINKKSKGKAIPLKEQITTLTFRINQELKDKIINDAIDNWTTPSKIVHKIIKNHYETELSRKATTTTSKGSVLPSASKISTTTTSTPRERIN